MKEKAGYRSELEKIKKQFGDNNLLSKKDVCDYTGCCYRTVIRHFSFNSNGKITQTELARQLV